MVFEGSIQLFHSRREILLYGCNYRRIGSWRTWDDLLGNGWEVSMVFPNLQVLTRSDW